LKNNYQEVKFQVLEKRLRKVEKMELGKGIFTKEEFLERVEVVDQERNKIK
jgi:hypothetical protein